MTDSQSNIELTIGELINEIQRRTCYRLTVQQVCDGLKLDPEGETEDTSVSVDLEMFTEWVNEWALSECGSEPKGEHCAGEKKDGEDCSSQVGLKPANDGRLYCRPHFDQGDKVPEPAPEPPPATGAPRDIRGELQDIIDTRVGKSPDELARKMNWLLRQLPGFDPEGHASRVSYIRRRMLQLQIDPQQFEWEDWPLQPKSKLASAPPASKPEDDSSPEGEYEPRRVKGTPVARQSSSGGSGTPPPTPPPVLPAATLGTPPAVVSPAVPATVPQGGTSMSSWDNLKGHGASTRAARSAAQQDIEDAAAALDDFVGEYRKNVKDSHLVALRIDETAKLLVKAFNSEADTQKLNASVEGLVTVLRAVHATADEATANAAIQAAIREEN